MNVVLAMVFVRQGVCIGVQGFSSVFKSTFNVIWDCMPSAKFHPFDFAIALGPILSSDS